MITATLTKSLTDKTVSLSVGLSDGSDKVKIRETVWSFGDGDSVTTGKQVREMSHTYATHGTYQVSVTVKDFHNRTATASATVVIEAPYVEPPPIDPMAGAAWSATKSLSASGAYQNVSASGNRVLVCQGDGTVVTAWSEDEGATFSAFGSKGTGATFLEHPIAIQGDRAVIISAAKNVSFDLFGTRQAGDLSIRTSVDGGKTFTAAKLFTSGRVAFRFGVVLDGDYVAVAWMHRRVVGTSSTWDIEFTESFNAFAATPVWSPVEVLFQGVTWIGGHRPSLYLSNGVLHMICFGEKIGKAPVAIDNLGRVLDPGTEVYHAKRINGVWTGKFVTNSPDYSGRPEIVVSGNTVVSVFDARSATSDNDVGIVVSRDGGDSFSGIDYLRQGVGEATHPVLAKHSSGLLACAWNETINNVKHNYIRFSTDDAVTWTPTAQISDVESGTPTIAFSANYLHVIAGKRSGSGMTHRRFGPIA
jgi:PKD repeat protein